MIYDKAMWKEAGYDQFPSTWEDVEKASEYFNGKGITTVAFGNGGKWQANSDSFPHWATVTPALTGL